MAILSGVVSQRLRRLVASGLILITLFPTLGFACDPCALYNVTRLTGHKEDALTIALSEQFTNFRRESSENPPRDGEFTRGYSTTQVTAAYDVSDRWGAQLSLPVVIRSFDDVEHFRQTEETESGIGDLAILGSYSPIVVREADRAYVWSLFGGVKFPTGDSGSLDDSINHNIDPGSEHGDDVHARALTVDALAHHQISTSSGLNGRILTIGTGSFDYIFGSSFLVRQDRIFALASVQYTLRTEGDFDYRFDNDTLWDAGPGAFVILDDRYSMALRAVFSGEHKGQDTLDGNHVDGSQVSNIYAGPEILLTWGEKLSGQIAVDIPISTNDVEGSVVPEYRLRTALSYHF